MNLSGWRVFVVLAIILCLVSSCKPYRTDSTLFLRNIKIKDDPANLQCIFFDTLNGDATLLRLPSGKAVLIDGGAGDEGRKIVEFLKSLGISKLDTVILTHPDIDHYGGLISVFDIFTVDKLYYTGLASWTPPYESFMEKVRDSKCKVYKVRQADIIDLGSEVSFLVFWPPHQVEDDKFSSHFANTMSMVGKLRFRNVSVLFTADVKQDSEAALAKKYGEGLKADILKVAHHGSKSSSSETFLKLVKPKIAVIMGEYYNIEIGAYRRAADQTVQRLKETGSKVFSTHKCGKLVIELDGKGIIRICPERMEREQY